jgi:hypothetical protein
VVEILPAGHQTHETVFGQLAGYCGVLGFMRWLFELKAIAGTTSSRCQ